MPRPRLLPIAALVLVGLSLVPSRDAHACGVWRLEDLELGHTVQLLCSGLHLERKGKRGRPILTVPEVPVERLSARVGGKTRFDFDGEVLRFDGKPVGTLRPVPLGAREETALADAADRRELTLRGQAFRVSVRRNPDHPEPGREMWLVEVLRGEAPIARGKAHAFCNVVTTPEREQREDVIKRTVFYLAWRELLRPRAGRRPTSR